MLEKAFRLVGIIDRAFAGRDEGQDLQMERGGFIPLSFIKPAWLCEPERTEAICTNLSLISLNIALVFQLRTTKPSNDDEASSSG